MASWCSEGPGLNQIEKTPDRFGMSLSFTPAHYFGFAPNPVPAYGRRGKGERLGYEASVNRGSASSVAASLFSGSSRREDNHCLP